jgi:hypothetical protein
MVNMHNEEVIRRLPETLTIQDDEIYSDTLKLFSEEVPEYFWTAPASTGGKYHPIDETEKHGLWLHTKRVFVIYERLIESLLEQRRMDEKEADLGRVAVLLHDSFRLGETDEGEDHTVAEHGEIAADIVRDNTSLDDRIAGAVEAHDGAWGKGKAPETDLEDIVHNADMVASERGINTAVINPHETLFNKDSVRVKEYVGMPRYDTAAERVAHSDLVYAFGCEKTRHGWRILLKSPYEAKDDIKELDNRWWNDNSKMWQVRADEYDLVLNKLREDGWRVDSDSRVEEFVNKRFDKQ